CKFTTIFQFCKELLCKKMLERSRRYLIDIKLDINVLCRYVVQHISGDFFSDLHPFTGVGGVKLGLKRCICDAFSWL
ncbi:MAG: hypothetical protein K2N19_06925, partial [Muribaculaceae bacterium]|nr:hypothetical protein [Muribaculaceae bacterium]